MTVVNFGCRLNSFESEIIKRNLKESGEEDLIVINSCSVTEEAERKLVSKIRNLHIKNPDKKIIVTGCAAQVNPEKYAAMNEVFKVVGNLEKMEKGFKVTDGVASGFHTENSHIDEIFRKQNHEDRNLYKVDHSKIHVSNIMNSHNRTPNLITNFESKTRASIEIQTGCDHRCTFCIIPYGRGNSVSTPVENIIKQAQMLIESGYKEIVLTGVDISGYGEDFERKISLAKMVTTLLHECDGLERLRFSSIDVAEIDGDLFDLISFNKKIMPHLHLSLQSGDDMILKRMKRRHNRGQIVDFCQRIRQFRPEMTFGSDIIVGFPTESEEAFQNSCDIITEQKIVFNHIFPYSVRSGTPAAKMPQLDKSVIKLRMEKLLRISDQQLREFHISQIGTFHNAVIETKNLARAENFMKIYLNGELKIGRIERIKILDYDEKNKRLIGDVVLDLSNKN